MARSVPFSVDEYWNYFTTEQFEMIMDRKMDSFYESVDMLDFFKNALINTSNSSFLYIIEELDDRSFDFRTTIPFLLSLYEKNRSKYENRKVRFEAVFFSPCS